MICHTDTNTFEMHERSTFLLILAKNTNIIIYDLIFPRKYHCDDLMRAKTYRLRCLNDIT